MDLKKLANRSSLHKEIISFFHNNPSSIDTPRGVSVWVHGDLVKVRQVLEELAQEGVLEADKVTSTTGYSYTRNPKIISQIEAILKKTR